MCALEVTRAKDCDCRWPLATFSAGIVGVAAFLVGFVVLTTKPWSDPNLIASAVALVLVMVMLGYGVVHFGKKYCLTSRRQRKLIATLAKGPDAEGYDQALFELDGILPGLAC